MTNIDQQHRHLLFPLEKIQALHGRELAMLSPDEIEVYRYVRDQGRSFGVLVTEETTADPNKLSLSSLQQAEELMRRARTKLSISMQDS